MEFPVSKLSSSFHCFGTFLTSSLKITATSLLKQSKKRIMHVQPEAVKRRKLQDGSRRAKVKGMNVSSKNNPFAAADPKLMRVHKFSSNTAENSLKKLEELWHTPNVAYKSVE